MIKLLPTPRYIQKGRYFRFVSTVPVHERALKLVAKALFNSIEKKWTTIVIVSLYKGLVADKGSFN